MQPSRNFDDLKFSSIHRRILLWGSGGPFLDGLCTGNDWRGAGATDSGAKTGR